jgi:hypothetical protein
MARLFFMSTRMSTRARFGQGTVFGFISFPRSGFAGNEHGQIFHQRASRPGEIFVENALASQQHAGRGQCITTITQDLRQLSSLPIMKNVAKHDHIRVFGIRITDKISRCGRESSG